MTMDEFELAGFDEETCEQLRKISFESGIEPYRLICVIRQGQTEPSLLDEFEKSRIRRFFIRLAYKLKAWLKRFIK